MAQVVDDEPHPAGSGLVPEQRLHHRQRDQLGVASPRRDTDRGTAWGAFGEGLQ
jgi:hypothetical protein